MWHGWSSRSTWVLQCHPRTVTWNHWRFSRVWLGQKLKNSFCLLVRQVVQSQIRMPVNVIIPDTLSCVRIKKYETHSSLMNDYKKNKKLQVVSQTFGIIKEMNLVPPIYTIDLEWEMYHCSTKSWMVLCQEMYPYLHLVSPFVPILLPSWMTSSILHHMKATSM